MRFFPKFRWEYKNAVGDDLIYTNSNKLLILNRQELTQVQTKSNKAIGSAGGLWTTTSTLISSFYCLSILTKASVTWLGSR